MEPSNGFSQQTTEVNNLNSKLAYDFSAQLQAQALIDNQAHARELRSFDLTVAQDAHTVRHLADVAALTSGQTGETENQQAVDPVRTGTGDALVAPAAVAADAVSASIGESALNNVTEQLGNLVTQVGTLAGLMAQLVANSTASAPPAK